MMKKFSLSDATADNTDIATARDHIEKERNVGRDCEQVEPKKKGGSGRM